MSTFNNETNRIERAARAAALNQPSDDPAPVDGQVGYLLLRRDVNYIVCNSCGQRIIQTMLERDANLKYERLAPDHMMREQKCANCKQKIRGE